MLHLIFRFTLVTIIRTGIRPTKVVSGMVHSQGVRQTQVAVDQCAAVRSIHASRFDLWIATNPVSPIDGTTQDSILSIDYKTCQTPLSIHLPPFRMDCDGSWISQVLADDHLVTSLHIGQLGYSDVVVLRIRPEDVMTGMVDGQPFSRWD